MNGKKVYRILFAGVVAVSFIAAVAAAGAPLSVPTGTQTVAPGTVSEKNIETRGTMTVPAPFTVVPAVASAPTTTENVEQKKPDVIEPLFVKPLVRIEPGKNDSNPQWSPRETFIAFERSMGDKKEIVIARPDGSIQQTIYFQWAAENNKEAKFFFPGITEEASYNAGLSWSPREDRVVFMSNGGEGNYDLYLKEISSKPSTTTRRLTNYKEKNGHAHWSPTADQIVFVSGRTGKGDVYLLDLGAEGLKRLTRGGKPYLYPQWSPDGKQIAMIHGSNENHDIYVIRDVTRPVESLKPLTTWTYDDLRPAWSPDGKQIAFYSNVNPAGDPKLWSLLVIAADGSDPMNGDGLVAKVVAQDVIPDIERGPAWMPDSARIVYVKNDKRGYNPMYVVDVKEKTSLLIRTDTKMNHDIACSSNGTIAFRAQINQWDHVMVMRLKQ